MQLSFKIPFVKIRFQLIRFNLLQYHSIFKFNLYQLIHLRNHTDFINLANWFIAIATVYLNFNWESCYLCLNLHLD